MTITILVADDEPDTGTLFRLSFRREIRQGLYAVDVAMSGSEALDKLAAYPAGQTVVLISDLAMPGMGGLELLEAASQSRPGMPVFIVSGYAGTGAAAALRAGATACLTKPLDFPALKQAIAAAVR